MAERKIIALLFTALIIWPCSLAMASAVNPSLSKKTLKAAADLHLPFVENKGQVADPAVAYEADTFACRVAVTRDGKIAYSFPAPKGGGGQIEIKEHLVSATIDVNPSL